MIARPGSSKSRTIGPYELVVELAKSPLGPLWVATTESGSGLEPRQLRRVPLGPRISESDISRLREAARFGRTLSSEHTQSVLDIVDAEEELALVGSYLPGETLRSLLRLSNFKRQAVPVGVALRIVLDICEALLEAELRAVSAPQGPDFHCGGLLPDSVLVGTDGKARLGDLGLAAVWRSVPGVAEHAEITAYSAPEQLDGGTLDSRTDVFIVGVLLWEMLTGGKRLFVGSSHRAVADKVHKHPVPALTDPGIAPAVQELVSKMLARDPRRRSRSISDLKTSLEALEPGQVAPAIEVSDFVTTFAHNPLSSRARVLERALNKPSPPMPSAATAPVAPPAAPREGGAAPLPAPASPPAQRPPLPSTPPARDFTSALPGAPPLRERPEVARSGARPLPLPAQAKLGTRISAPDGMLPPPPPPEPAVPTAPGVEEQGEDDSSSVRAADILRALAVEDAAPPSDELPTLRPPQERVAPQPVALALPQTPGETRAAMETLPGHALPSSGDLVLPEPRPPLQTIPGYAPPVNHASPPPLTSAESPGRDSAPGDEPDAAPRASDALRSRTPLTPAVSPAAPGTPLTSTGSALASDAAVAGLPARRPGMGERRLPLALAFALGGAAVLLLLGFLFAGNDDDSAGDEPRTAQHEPSTSDRDVGKQNGSGEPGAAAPATPVHESEPARDEPDGPPGDSSAEDGPEPSSDPASRPEAEAPPQSAAAPPRPAQPSTRPANAAPRRTTPSAPQRSSKLRAKRTFIPSGI